MRDYAELKSMAECAAGFTDMSLAPDVVLGLIADVERMTSIAYAMHGADYMEMLAERDQLKAENEALRNVMSVVTSEIPNGQYIQPENAPGHCHDIPGIWDQGNGEKSGKECGWCKVWNAARKMSKEP